MTTISFLIVVGFLVLVQPPLSISSNITTNKYVLFILPYLFFYILVIIKYYNPVTVLEPVLNIFLLFSILIISVLFYVLGHAVFFFLNPELRPNSLLNFELLLQGYNFYIDVRYLLNVSDVEQYVSEVVLRTFEQKISVPSELNSEFRKIKEQAIISISENYSLGISELNNQLESFKVTIDEFNTDQKVLLQKEEDSTLFNRFTKDDYFAVGFSFGVLFNMSCNLIISIIFK